MSSPRIAPSSGAAAAVIQVARALVPAIGRAQRIDSTQRLLFSADVALELGGDSGQPSLATAVADSHLTPVGNPPCRTMPGVDGPWPGLSVPGSAVGGKGASA